MIVFLELISNLFEKICKKKLKEVRFLLKPNFSAKNQR